MITEIDTLIEPRWVVDTEPGVVAHLECAVAVDRGKVLAVGPAAQLSERFRARTHFRREQHVLMPGLINAHCHGAMSLMRGFADDLALDQWLSEKIWPAESRYVTREFVADGTRLAVAEMLRGGITCFSDMYYFPDVVADVAILAGIRAVIGMIALEFPTVWAENADEYISKGLTVHDQFRAEQLITTAFAPHAPYTVSDSTLDTIRKLADELDVPIHTHIHETVSEIENAVKESGQRPLERLATLGLVNSGLIGVHATQLTDAEIAALGQARANVVHCPRSNLKLASGACRVDDLLTAGVNVALGTDGAASNNRLDLWSEMQTAALLGKHIAQDATAIPAPTALRMATINGARALGLAEVTGSVAEGKQADMICVDLGRVGQQPIFDPLSQLVYSTGRDQVTDVWVAGEHLVDQGRLTRTDETEIVVAANRWARQLSAQ